MFGSLNGELQCSTGSESDGRVCAMRRRSPDRAATRRGRLGTAGHDMSTPPCACQPARQFNFYFLGFLRSPVAPQQQPQQLRRAHACSPPQKHELRLHHSSIVFSSTSSTSQPCRLGLGKGAFAVSTTAAMTGPRWSWRSMRPTTTEAFPSPPLCLVSMVATSRSSYRA